MESSILSSSNSRLEKSASTPSDFAPLTKIFATLPFDLIKFIPSSHFELLTLKLTLSNFVSTIVKHPVNP
jgi:hypothetical protein